MHIHLLVLQPVRKTAFHLSFPQNKIEAGASETKQKRSCFSRTETAKYANPKEPFLRRRRSFLGVENSFTRVIEKRNRGGGSNRTPRCHRRRLVFSQGKRVPQIEGGAV